jgi:tetratricopeptide (TPR) repeat protein
MKSLAQLPYSDFALTLLSGSEKGTSFRLVSGRVTIGRASENDIVIKDDPKISRQHAILLITSRGVEISDASDRNKVIVNSEEITSSMLSPGAIIQLGDTKFQLKQLSSTQQDLVERGYNIGQPAQTKPTGPSSRSRKPKKSNSFYITVGIVALVMIWLLTSNTDKKKDQQIRFGSDVDASIQTNTEKIEQLQDEREKAGFNTRQYEEAQPNFVKGFRDYRKGQYDRAIESFQACLSLFPQHTQCQRYLRLSQKKFSELIQYHMVLGGRYKDQNQFSACKSAYRNAMVMIRNKTDKNYLEAKTGYETCELLEGDRY